MLTDPAETGAVTLALPQDVQAEALRLAGRAVRAARLARRAGRRPSRRRSAEAAALLRGARAPADRRRRRRRSTPRRPTRCARFAEATGIPVGETQAGKGSLPYDHPQSLGAIGATGTTAANALAREADVVIGVGTRWSDFTTASRTRVRRTRTCASSTSTSRAFDAFKHAGAAAGRATRARRSRSSAARSRASRSTPSTRERAARLAARVGRDGRARLHARPRPAARARREVIGAVNRRLASRATSSSARRAAMPGDLHKLWRTRDPKGYHVEYGYSCMGYEIAGGLGVKMAAPDREVFVMVGDGSYLMMAQEIVTAVAGGRQADRRAGPEPRLRLDRRAVGVARLAALRHRYRYRDRRAPTATLPVDLAANAASLGADVLRADDRRRARGRAARGARGRRARPSSTIETDPLVPAPELRGLVGRARRRGLRRSTPRAPRARPTSANKQTQQQYLNPRERGTP